MSKILMYVVAAVVVVGGGYWVMTQQGSAQPAAESGIPAAPAEQGVSPSSFADMVKAGGGFECSITTEQQGMTVHGTIHVANAGADVRGDFTSQVAGKDVRSSLVKTGGYVYVWSDMMPRGMKVAAGPDQDPLAQMNNGTVPAGTHYDCHQWTVDAAMFVVPSDVSFMTMPGQ